MEIGTLAEWAGALATAAATVVALVAGRVALRSFHRDRENEARADADRVHAWMADGRNAGSGSMVLMVEQGGLSPIYDVKVKTTLEGERSEVPIAGVG